MGLVVRIDKTRLRGQPAVASTQFGRGRHVGLVRLHPGLLILRVLLTGWALDLKFTVT